MPKINNSKINNQQDQENSIMNAATVSSTIVAEITEDHDNQRCERSLAGAHWHCHCELKISSIMAGQTRTCELCYGSVYYATEINSARGVQFGTFNHATRIAYAHGLDTDKIQTLITEDGRTVYQPMIKENDRWRPVCPIDLYPVFGQPVDLATAVAMVLEDRQQSSDYTTPEESIKHLFSIMTADDVESTGRPFLDNAYRYVLSAGKWEALRASKFVRPPQKSISVQVAAEAIISAPHAYDWQTINAVRVEAIAFNLPGSIIDALPEMPRGEKEDLYTEDQFR